MLLGMQAHEDGYSVIICHADGFKDKEAGGSNASVSLSPFH